MAPPKTPVKGSSSSTSLLELGKTLKDEESGNRRLNVYDSMAKLITSNKASRSEAQASLQTIDLPAVLKDVTAGSDELALGALGFLGALLQLVKLSLERQVDVVRGLTEKVSKPQEKNISRKVMWSLANLQFDSVHLPEEQLDAMLGAAIRFLDEIKNPPIISLSTVCESINTLANIANRRKSFFIDRLPTIWASLSPWLFYYEADRIRQLALHCLEPFSTDIAAAKMLDSSFQAQLKEKYRNDLMQLIAGEYLDGLKIWSFLIQSFGTSLHDSVALLNDLLKVEESALKSKNPVFRQRALEHWKSVVDCFALNPAVLNNSKRIKLVLVPLKSTDSRTAEFARTKIHIWWHLLDRLGPDAAYRFHEVTLPLLTFCFGPGQQQQQPTAKGTALTFPDVMPLAISVLTAVLSPEESFSSNEITGPNRLNRSSVFLVPEDFKQSVDLMGQYCLLALEHRPVSDESAAASFTIQIRCALHSFLARCSSTEELDEPLGRFIRSLIEFVVGHPSLMEAVFGVLVDFFANGCVMKAQVNNAGILLRWYAENEPLPAHPCVGYLNRFFAAGPAGDVPLFTSCVCEALASLPAGNPAGADLWVQYASCLVANCKAISSADRRSLLLPLTGLLQDIKTDNQAFLTQWSSLFTLWAKEDPAVFERVLNPSNLPEEVEVDTRVVRFVLKAVKSDIASTYASHSTAWIQRWATSWSKSSIPRKTRTESSNELAGFIQLLLDETERPTADTLLKEVHTALNQVVTNSAGGALQEIQEALQGIFGTASTCFKSAVIQKLRKNQKVTKLFADLAPRSKQKAKQVDDFVVVPPPSKPVKRVLTEHQKEVSRAKRRSSTVPALYSDLSQSSLPSESCSMMESSSILPENPSVVVPSIGSLVRQEEDALLEPPSPVTTNDRAKLADSPSMDKENPSNSSTVKELLKKDQKLCSKVSVRIEKITTRKSARQSTSEPEAQSPKYPAQRPCPKSKKVGYSRSEKEVTPSQLEVSDATNIPPQETTLPSPSKESEQPASAPVTDENVVKEPEQPVAVDQEVMEVSTVEEVVETTEAATMAEGPPPLISVDEEPFGVVVEEVIVAEAAEPEEIPASAIPDLVPIEEPMDSAPVVVEKTNEGLLQSDVISSASVFVEESNKELPKTDPTGPTDSVVVMVEESNGGLPPLLKCLDRKDKEAEEEEGSAANVPALVAVDPEPEAAAVEPATEVGSVPQQQRKGLPFPIKGLQAVKALQQQNASRSARKRTASGGPTHSTSKRGAQMLELSRQKIQNNNNNSINGNEIPPGKKAKMSESLAETVLTELTTKSGITVNGLSSVSLLDCVVVTPESSPARKIPWLAKTYSPCASPSAGILKKRGGVGQGQHPDEAGGSEEVSVENSPISSSATKSRRVSFADPEVSHSVKISPASKSGSAQRSRMSRSSSSNRLRRSLIVSYAGDPASSGNADDVVKSIEEVTEKEATPLPAESVEPSDIKAAVTDPSENCTIGSELATFISSAVPDVFVSRSKEESAEPMDTTVSVDCMTKIEKPNDEADPTPSSQPEPKSELVRNESTGKDCILATPLEKSEENDVASSDEALEVCPVFSPDPTPASELPIDDVLALIERHSCKNEILMAIARRHLTISLN